MIPPPIINQPDTVSLPRRRVYRALTAILWAVYVYLWVPLLTLVAWLVGGRAAWQRFYGDQSSVDLFLLAALPIIAVICAVVLIGWAEYNRLRFSKADKRQHCAEVTPSQLAEILHADPALAQDLREGRIVRLTMDETSAAPVSVVVQRK